MRGLWTQKVKMGKSSDAPVRTCIGCRAKLPKHRLIRFSAGEDGRLIPDPLYLHTGRGAYLCPSKSCFKRAFKRKDAFPRALRRKVKAPQHPDALVQEALCALMKERERMKGRLERLREGEGRRLSLGLQRICEMIERLRICEE